MAELLLELFSEEIPARMQARAAEDLKRLVTEGLKAQGLAAGEARAFATPRRLALVVEGVPAKSPDVSEERKGPRVNAPEQAIAGLPEPFRDVYVLADVEGLPNAEIGEMLDLSLPAVKSRLHRARLRMRDALAPHFEEAAP